MRWQDEVDELKRHEELAAAMGGEELIQRQHDNERLTVREPIDALADPDSFHEIGALAGKASYSDDGKLEDFTQQSPVRVMAMPIDLSCAMHGRQQTGVHCPSRAECRPPTAET